MNAADIEAEYQRRLARHPEASWGWSFMYTPEAWLSSAKLVLVGLNPGGAQEHASGQWEPSHGGNAYTDEDWRGAGKGEDPLQRQIKAMFEAAGVRRDQVFAANFVPFRSPSWAALPERDAALNFSRELWRNLLPKTRARLFVSLGKAAGEEIAQLLDAARAGAIPAEWGSQTIDKFVSNRGEVVLSVPHLSRYKVFGGGRTAAADAIASAAREAAPASRRWTWGLGGLGFQRGKAQSSPH